MSKHNDDIDQDLHDDLVENVEVSDEELMEIEEASVDPEVDGEKVADEAGSKVKKSAPAKTKEPSVEKAKQDKMDKVKESFDEDLDALVESEATLSEGFRAKAEVIFEAALKSKLSEHVDRLETEYAEALVEETAQIKADLVEKVDSYLNYVVENWVEENRLAIESGLRTEIAESFMSALHGVFTEHYVEVPESKVDLVDNLASHVEELEEKLNDSLHQTLALQEEIETLTRESVIREAATDLSEAQTEKLKGLVEDIDFENKETFAEKVSTIKESYFNKGTKKQEDKFDEISESVEQKEVSPLMSRYLAALNK